MIALSGRGIEIRSEASRLRPTDVVRALGDATRAKQLLHWAPAISWESTVDWVLEYWRRQVRAEPATAGVAC
jgi:GDP-4-dehydro-6-deoxy-D-mannose reductase